jgi:hypothetical protein
MEFSVSGVDAVDDIGCALGACIALSFSTLHVHLAVLIAVIYSVSFVSIFFLLRSYFALIV